MHIDKWGTNFSGISMQNLLIEHMQKERKKTLVVMLWFE
jgi:hypothetical protein